MLLTGIEQFCDIFHVLHATQHDVVASTSTHCQHGKHTLGEAKPRKATCEWNVTWKYTYTKVSLAKGSQKDVSSPSVSKKGGLTSVLGGDSSSRDMRVECHLEGHLDGSVPVECYLEVQLD